MLIITGASGGIGRYLVEKLSSEFQIVGTYNSNKPSNKYDNVEYFKVDTTNSNDIAQFMSSVSNRLKDIVLINVAGVSIDGVGHKMDEETWDKVIDTNLKGTFLMSRAMLPLMRQQNWGRIINFSSIVGQVGIPGTVAYSSSKSGLMGLTRTLQG